MLTISILVAATFLTQGLRSLVPRVGASTMRVGTEDFLRASQNQDIEWRELGPEAFQEAKLRDRPILLVCGDAMDMIAQHMDSKVFSDREVCAWLRSSFVCVRVDLAKNPEWRDIYLQMDRARGHYNPNWHAWMIHPNGRTFSRVLVNQKEYLNSRWFVNILRSGVQTFRALQRGDSGTVAGEAQAQNKEFLQNSPPADPDLGGYGDYLMEYAASTMQAAGRSAQILPPTQQILFLFLAGRTADATQLLDRMLASPLTDWVDGGIFQQATDYGLTQVAFQKSALRVADFMHLSTIAYLRTRNPLYKYVAEQAFESLSGRMEQSGFIRGTQFSDTDDHGRSAVYSMTFREIRETLSPADRDRLNKFFRFDPTIFPQQSLVLRDVATASANMQEFADVLAKLRPVKRGKVRTYGSEQQADVSGVAVARMLRAARAFGDEKMAQRANELQANLGSLVVGNSVLHSLRILNEGHATLKDSLAMADSYLEQYLLAGSLASLRTGALILANAMSEFGGPRAGVLLNWRPRDPENWPVDIGVAGLVDSFGESSVSMAIRLSNNYGTILGGIELDDVPSELAGQLKEFARTSIRVFGAPATRIGWNAAGYFCSSWRVARSPMVLVKGVTAISTANGLAPRLAHRFVGPLIGQLRPEWAAKADGCYILRDGAVTGPLSPDEVMAMEGG